MNKICCDPLLRAVAMSMNKFEVEGLKNNQMNLKVLKNFLFKFKKSFNIENVNNDEFLNKNILITNESLMNSIALLNCKNYLEYVLMIITALRSASVKARLCVCFEVIQMPDHRVKDNHSAKNYSDSEEEDNESQSDVTSTQSSSKGTKKRKSDPAIELKGSKKTKLADSGEEEEKIKTDESTKKKAATLLKTKATCKNSKILSTDDDDQEVTSILKDTDYRNHWLEVYLDDEQRWICVEPFGMKIDCTNDMEKRFSKQILYVCGYDNDNRVKDLTKRYSKDWLTSVRRLRVGQLEPKKLWWERTLLFYQPIDANLDIQEEIQLKS